jgi:hypothetical protein
VATVTTYRRDLKVSDGLYAVEDVDGQLTYWSVRAGRWADYPPDARWRPMPPRSDERVSRAEHRQRVADWYECEYADYCEHVADAIEADPGGARQRFADRHGERPVPPPPARKAPQPTSRTLESAKRRGVRQARAERARRRQEDLAVVLRLAGMPYRRIATMLGCSPRTAWRRAERARHPQLARDYLPWTTSAEGFRLGAPNPYVETPPTSKAPDRREDAE